MTFLSKLRRPTFRNYFLISEKRIWLIVFFLVIAEVSVLIYNWFFQIYNIRVVGVITAVTAVLCGVIFCLYLEVKDNTLKHYEDVKFYTKMPFLGYIPSFKKIKDVRAIELIAHNQPSSYLAEAFKEVKESLVASYRQAPLTTIAVTSSVPKEGKTIFACNLAIAFAQADEPTLLIDADIRKGDIAEKFGMGAAKGLTNILSGESSFENAVVSTAIDNLSFLSAGSRVPNPNDLINSGILKDVFQEAKARFARVIIDTPPLLTIGDTLILTKDIDILLLVARIRHTFLDQIIAAKKTLGNKAKSIAVVVNGS